jgi:HlyD family secretion protein
MTSIVLQKIATDVQRQEVTNDERPFIPQEPSPDQMAPTRLTRRAASTLVLAVGALFVGLLTTGLTLHHREAAALTHEAATARAQHPTVNVVTVHRSTAGTDLTLPGIALGFYAAEISARASGYVGKLPVDIGSALKTGELLAQIDAPDLDQQVLQAEADVLQAKAAVEQARANVTQAEANLALARTEVPLAQASHQFQVFELSRIKGISDVDSAAAFEVAQAQRDFDVTNAQVSEAEATVVSREASLAVFRAAVQTSQASLSAMEANLGRLKELQGFERVTAPYDGVVTRRNIDLGTLVTAGNSSPGTLMFNFAMIDVLKVQLDIPQAYAPSIVDGLGVTTRVREYPSRTFSGTVTRSASALDPATRTLRTQIDIPNKDHTLLPGMYLSVTLHVQRSEPAVRVPASALITRAEGTMVAVISADGRLSYRKIEIARDLGDHLAVTAGIEDGETVAVNLGADYLEGTKVSPLVIKGQS